MITSRVYCSGEFSCANINHFEINETLYCEGSASCFVSNITRSISSVNNTYIFFEGYNYKSGAYSTINVYQTTRIHVDGTLSLYNANINTAIILIVALPIIC